MREVIIGGTYRHFKGGEYIVEAIAKFSEDHSKELVIYKDKDGNIWARPKEMFLSDVDKEKYPDVKQKHRFRLVVAPASSLKPTITPCGK